MSVRRIVALLLLLAPCVSRAVGCELEPQENADAYVSHVARLHSVLRCFGRQNDAAEITRRVHSQLDALDAPMRTAAEVSAVQGQAVDALEEIELSLATSESSAPALWRPGFSIVRQRLSGAAAQVASLDARVTVTPWEHDDLTYFEGELDLKPLIRGSCDASFSVECVAGLDSAAALLRHAELVHRVLFDVLSERRLLPLYEQVAALDAQWTNYFERGRSQYLWELALNSWRYQRSVSGSQLAPPPPGQWILLHPGAAVEYASDGPAGQTEVNAVAIVELVGYNRWSGFGPLVTWPLGVAAVATVSPESRGDRLGWGVVVHVNNRYSIGAARRDLGDGKETTWLVSVDLGKLFLQAREQTRHAFRFE